jgi:hypothetical protein
MAPKLKILVGIPFNAKIMTYAKSLDGYTILSRDWVRHHIYGDYCIITEEMERKTTEDFNFRLKKAYLLNLNVVLCGSNCREGYIDKLIAECPIEYDIEVKFFDYPLWKAIIKNFINHRKTGIFIPIYILYTLKRGYDAINKEKYRHYSEKLAISQQKL